MSILNWRQKAITGVLEARMTELVFRLIGWARYAQIPVCNLPTKGCLLDYVTNIQFSRLLHSGDHLTWWD